MSILNPHHDPYLEFAEKERRAGKKQFAPWTTSNPELLNLAELYFPEIPITPVNQLEKPDLRPVEIIALKTHPALQQVAHNSSFIAVGGPPAAMVALEVAHQGRPVLYVNDQDAASPDKQRRPIWAGAGNHGEPDALTEGPAYITGHYPLGFLMRELLRACMPPGYDSAVLHPDYSWLSLNWSEWLQNPRQWPAAFRVAFGNHQLAKQYLKALHQGKLPAVLEKMQKKTQDSWLYLQEQKELLREPRGSLLLAASPQQLQNLLYNQAFLRQEGRELRPISPEEAQKKYGLLPRNALGLMEKTHDFMLVPDFLKKISLKIKKQSGEIKTTWRLVRIYLDTDQQEGGIMEFSETNAQGEKSHFRRFSHAHLSLGATPFKPAKYDLISVTGVSMNVLVFGADFHGGPIVFGGTNHLVPLMPPQTIEIKNPRNGKIQALPVTFARLSAAGSVSPLDRGATWYHYDGRHAVHLLHRVRESLSPGMSLHVLSVIGCNRVIGKDGYQVEFHPTIQVDHQKITCKQLTIQVGAGGGGLTQMGALPQKMREQASE